LYIHLGGDVLINKNKIVAIIDLETITEGKNNKKFLDSIKINQKINYVSENGKEKTLIYYNERTLFITDFSNNFIQKILF